MNEGAITQVGCTHRLARGKRQVREVVTPPGVALAVDTLVTTEHIIGAAEVGAMLDAS